MKKINLLIALLCAFFSAFSQENQLQSIARFQTWDRLIYASGNIRPLPPKSRRSREIAMESSALSAPIPPIITGGFLVNEIRNAINGIIDHVGNVVPAMSAQITGDLNILSSNIIAQIKDLTKPISELNRTLQQLAQRALVAIDQAKYFISATLNCLKYDLEYLTSGLQNSIHGIVSDVVPWARTNPVITRVYQKGSNTPFGFRIGKPVTLILEGFNLQSKQNKISAEIFRSGDAIRKLKTTIQGADRNKIILFVDTAKETGDFIVKVTLNRGRFLGIGTRPIELSNLVVILGNPQFKVQYQIKPACVVYPTINFKAGEIHGDNYSCDGDKIFGGNFILPADWTYTGHSYVLNSCNGCGLLNNKYLGGNAVLIQFKLPEKGGIFCTGPGKWVHADVYIQGKKQAIDNTKLYSGEYPGSLTFNQTVQVISLQGDPCSEINSWTVSVTLIYPDGTTHNIPATTGDGVISGSNQEGAAFYWNSSLKTLTVSTPTYNCGLL